MTNRQYVPVTNYAANEWSTFYFDFHAAPEIHCCAACCPCIVFGQNAKKFRNLGSCIGPCCLYTLFCYLVP